MKHLKQLIHLILIALLTSHCGSSSNVNKIFLADSGESNAVDALITQAQAYYDAKNYAKASSTVAKVLATEPLNQEANILNSYVNLATAGFDIITIVGKVINTASTSTSTSSTTKTSLDLAGTTTTNSNTNSNTNSTSGTQNATSLLDQLSTDLFADPAVLLANLTTMSITAADGSTVNAPTGMVFPVNTTTARTRLPITQINAVMTTFCPYVTDSVKAVDPNRYPCTPYTGEIRSGAKIYFLWGIAHLVEAIAFYIPLSNALTGLSAKVTSLSSQTINASNVSSYISDVTASVNMVNYILPSTSSTGTDTSLFSAILADLKATTLALGHIKGIPADVTTSIDNALTSLTTTATKIQTGSATNQSLQQVSTTKLKDQMTAAVSKTLATKIDSLSSSNQLTAQQKTDACAALKALSSTIAASACP